MITVGFSTRKIDENFVELLKKSSGLPKIDIIPIENNGEYSLTQAYNKILSQSSNDIVVLCHDDIYFDTKNWGQKILKHFKRNEDFGILGVAGSVSLPKSGKWWEDFWKMRGIVNALSFTFGYVKSYWYRLRMLGPKEWLGIRGKNNSPPFYAYFFFNKGGGEFSFACLGILVGKAPK